jgi:DNA-binding response OmpR family regulator
MVKILVVEKNVERQQTLNFILKAEGYEVIGSTDFDTAWLKFQSSEPLVDLVILAHPEEGAAKFLLRKHKESWSRSVPVIFLLREEEKSNQQEMAAGPKQKFWRYVPVPYNPHKLLGIIAELVSAPCR